MASFPGQNRGSGRLGIEGVGLPAEAAILTTWSNDLEHQLAFALKVTGETDAVAAGPLDAEGRDLTKSSGPGHESRVTANRGRDLQMPEISTEHVFGVPDVAVLMRVDADDDA
jgi:hypothetical protein